MDYIQNNFGLRLRSMLERRGNPYVEFQAACGISRSTLFNWFKREKAPPGERHHKALIGFFKEESADYILNGKLDSVQKWETNPTDPGVKEELDQALQVMRKIFSEIDRKSDVAQLKDEISNLRLQLKELKTQLDASKQRSKLRRDALSKRAKAYMEATEPPAPKQVIVKQENEGDSHSTGLRQA